MYDEIKRYKKSNYVFQPYKGDSAIGATESVTMTIKVKGMYSRVSLISMIAPSPDWFVGVNGRDLCANNGQWIDSETVNLFAWDAGTDHGFSFDSANNATMPPDVIRMITANSDTVIGNNVGKPFGKFVIERQTTSSMTTAKPTSASTHGQAARAFILLTVILLALHLLD